MYQNDGAELDDRKALEVFILNNPELEYLETKIGQFNIFEAVGMVRQEIRHSHFLAFLLNPSENHGLDDLFLKQLLIHTLSRADSAPFKLTHQISEVHLFKLNVTA